MSNTAIQVENISKMFHLGTIGSGSLRRDMQTWWGKYILKNPSPYYSIDEPANKKFIWALKNVDFEIKQGEAWGIIGRNGAGKSTFLKILSRIIKPTSGTIRGKGKVSSLLEIGTGFHAELTGRENIFISGHILGMKRYEILQKFDEIVEFAGIGTFIDTPVKRYSSGMYVRLAFAVAAHLEPDILIVDEVLAVGDAEFQKKCLGKMNEASAKSGRTIIFVSHNLQAIGNLCTNAIWLDKGNVCAKGNVKTVLDDYLSSVQKKVYKQEYTSFNDAPGNDLIKVTYVEIVPHFLEDAILDVRTPITVKFRFYNFAATNLSIDLMLFSASGDCIFDIPSTPLVFDEGFVDGECTIPGNFLNDGSYYISFYFVKDTSRELFYFEECVHFEIEDYRDNTNWYDKWWGYVRPAFPIILKPNLLNSSKDYF